MVLQNQQNWHKPLDALRKEKTQITNIRNEPGNINTNPTEIKRIVREHYEQPHTKKWDNLEDMNKLLKNKTYQG